MEFWIAIVVLAYFLAGITRINSEIRGGRLSKLSEVRERKVGIAVAAVFLWPLYTRGAQFFFSMIIALGLTAVLMLSAGVLVGLVWQIAIVASIYGLFLLSNLSMLED